MDTKFDRKPEGLDLKARIVIPGLTLPTELQRTEDAIIDDQGDPSFVDISSSDLDVQSEEQKLGTVVEIGHLDLLKSALTLIIDKAEVIDINVDKPKLLGKLKGALEILNQN